MISVEFIKPFAMVEIKVILAKQNNNKHMIESIKPIRKAGEYVPQYQSSY